MIQLLATTLLVAGLLAGCASSPAPAPSEAPVADESPKDLFPDLSADLERQMAARREDALRRGAEQKALEIDPFSTDGLEGRLRELGVNRFAGCTTDPEGFRDLESLIGYRLLRPGDYRAREPSFREGGLPTRVEARAAIVPVVLISCMTQVVSRPIAAGGFEATLDGLTWKALFDRSLSWWNPERAGDETARLHGQLHFDIAHLLAKEANRPTGRSLRGTGMTDRAARDDLQLQLADRIGELERELRRITGALDHATTKGHDPAATLLWEDRVRHGLGAVRRHLPPREPQARVGPEHRASETGSSRRGAP